MDLATLEKVVPELRNALHGRRFGRVFQLAKFDLAIDLRLAGSNYLFISVAPKDPRIYLIRRRLRDLDRASIGPSAFTNAIRKNFSNAVVTGVGETPGDRVIELRVKGENELGMPFGGSLVIQLTGRSANLFLTNEKGVILDRLRETRGEGQEIGTKYRPPQRRSLLAAKEPALPEIQGSISEYLDRLDLEKQNAHQFQSLVNAARSRFRHRLTKLERRKAVLRDDIASHGDADKWKRFGDVLLANVSTAKRLEENFLATDYFDESVPEILIPFENDDSVTETAERYFRKYAKARNAKEEVAARIAATDLEIEELNRRSDDLERAIEEADRGYIENFLADNKHPKHRLGERKPVSTDGAARSFTSSDGFEILVGKKAKDNDVLTFKIAKSLDTWMHAADYPGSHVVIRNPNRKEIPHRTLIEAAELAAFYSQGKTQVKAAVHYTQKKFVNKPKGAAPGLVSLSSFKTLLVEPKVPDSLIA